MRISKNKKFLYYLRGLIFNKIFLDDFKKRISELRKGLSLEQQENVRNRVDYYCKIFSSFHSSGKTYIKDLKKPRALNLIILIHMSMLVFLMRICP